jgi:hypothetical protein
MGCKYRALNKNMQLRKAIIFLLKKRSINIKNIIAGMVKTAATLKRYIKFAANI